MVVKPLEYATPSLRPRPKVARIIWTSLAVVAAVIAIGAILHFTRHRLVFVNQSGVSTGSLTVDVNGLTMIASPYQSGETRLWFESQEGHAIARSGTITVTGKLADGTDVSATLPYSISGGFLNYKSEVVIGPGGVVTFVP